ncbi:MULTISPECIES: DUF4259 domain-containing protein [Streptomyces]|uniref:DUF4259 domain-containing protein n=1 Tax=Streptomyces TaxID=1883 RepID=UPI002F921AFF
MLPTVRDRDRRWRRPGWWEGFAWTGTRRGRPRSTAGRTRAASGCSSRWHGAGAGVLRRDHRLRFDGADLQPLAVEALDRVVAEASELAELWDETPEGPRWRQNISSRRPRA